MTLIAVQEWAMPDKPIVDQLREMCVCGHRRHAHDQEIGGCITCSQDRGVRMDRCQRFRLDPIAHETMGDKCRCGHTRRRHRYRDGRNIGCIGCEITNVVEEDRCKQFVFCE